MDTSDNDTLKTIDTTMLMPLVRRALNRDAAEMMDWQSNQLYGAGLNSKIVRFSGNARDRDAVLPWSLILKIVHPHDGEDNPVSLRYWKREALAFQSGLLDDLPGKIRAPRCYGVVEQPGTEVWLWLEEVLDDIKGTWPVDQYGNVARHLGEFNGIFFENTSAFSHPLVARFCPDDVYQWMQEIWSEHTAWLDFIERQTQTLSHLDVFRRNSFARLSPHDELQTVLIDWAFVAVQRLARRLRLSLQRVLTFWKSIQPKPILSIRLSSQLILKAYAQQAGRAIHASSALPMPSLQC